MSYPHGLPLHDTNRVVRERRAAEWPDTGEKTPGDIVRNVHPATRDRYPLGRVEHVDTYRRSTDGSTVHDIRVRTGPGSTVHSSADQWAVVTLHGETGALLCPECGAEVWDGPQGSKLAKCWNTAGHASGGTLAFDTMDDELAWRDGTKPVTS